MLGLTTLWRVTCFFKHQNKYMYMNDDFHLVWIYSFQIVIKMNTLACIFIILFFKDFSTCVVIRHWRTLPAWISANTGQCIIYGILALGSDKNFTVSRVYIVASRRHFCRYAVKKIWVISTGDLHFKSRPAAAWLINWSSNNLESVVNVNVALLRFTVLDVFVCFFFYIGKTN